MKTQLGENISKRRKALGLNQEALAERIGVHVNTIKNIERGLSEGQPETRKSIAKALNCELWQLVGGQGETIATPQSSDRASKILKIQSELMSLSMEQLVDLEDALEMIKIQPSADMGEITRKVK